MSLQYREQSTYLWNLWMFLSLEKKCLFYSSSDEGQKLSLSGLDENKLSGPETCKSSTVGNREANIPCRLCLALCNGSQNPQVYREMKRSKRRR